MRQVKWIYGIAVLITIVTVFVCLTVGSYRISISEIVAVFRGGGTPIQRMTILDIRLARICTAIIVGAALCTAGSIFQSLTKNDLAEPGIMGINAGASLAVVLVINSGGSFYYQALSLGKMVLLPFAALLGGILAAAFIFRLSSKNGHLMREVLVLMGIGINAGLNAVITFFQLRMSKGDYNQALTWISGSLWGSNWSYFGLVAPFIILILIYVLYKGKTLDVMDLDEPMAIGVGVDITRERKIFFLLSVCLASLATAVAGNLAFVGLLGPHIAKQLAGPSYRKHIPLGIMISSVLIVVADTICRNAFSPLEIPAGIMISMIGVPYFIWLMIKDKGRA